ncbi:unnamed protein product [Acanthoscelides obtectus]|uniref:Kinesin motor domain-containing protein n=1 Tax=Acanthoscelides obtectus TaxID=200917 RepID=A0A9P0KSH3_ACAOB|nr:unnamed protein product [Acanthoscelides obtectus]CAK1628621.1 Kinesin-like protein KIF13A [Acanthoscelides obtectus]
MSTDKIKVAVRLRPFNRRELELGAQCVVEMDKQQTIVHQPTTLDKMESRVGRSLNTEAPRLLRGARRHLVDSIFVLSKVTLINSQKIS